MKQEKQDRRSRRTHRLVSSAMMDLLAEKRYDAITVQDLLDRAEIGRSTFYAHYFDKEDVLASMAEQHFEALSQQSSQRDMEQRIVPSLELFRLVYQHQHRQYCPAMARGQTGEMAWKIGQALLIRNIEQALAAAYAGKCSPPVPLAITAQYLAGALINLLKWWLEAEMPYTPEQMDRIFQQLALPGVWAAIEERDLA